MKDFITKKDIINLLKTKPREVIDSTMEFDISKELGLFITVTFGCNCEKYWVDPDFADDFEHNGYWANDPNKFTVTILEITLDTASRYVKLEFTPDELEALTINKEVFEELKDKYLEY